MNYILLHFLQKRITFWTVEHYFPVINHVEEDCHLIVISVGGIYIFPPVYLAPRHIELSINEFMNFKVSVISVIGPYWDWNKKIFAKCSIYALPTSSLWFRSKEVKTVHIHRLGSVSLIFEIGPFWARNDQDAQSRLCLPHLWDRAILSQKRSRCFI